MSRDFGTLETSEVHKPGTHRRRKSHGIKIHTDAGITDEYVSTVTTIEPATLEWVSGLVLGTNALERERIYDEIKRATRHVGRLGIAPLDIALWDLAGKYYGAPVYELLFLRRGRRHRVGPKLLCRISTTARQTHGSELFIIVSNMA